MFVVKEAGDFLKHAYEAATESNKVIAQTGAVIKSTGDASHVSAGQVEELGLAIAHKTGLDHDQIQVAENLLLTFTNVRNEAGKGNDIFNQTTKVAVDMGAALGGDASSNAIRLGRALQDPVKGLTALTRVGVTFSAAQKEQIKTMAEHGDMVGAQKAILAELNKEFGGSAEAQATSATKLKESWKEIQQQIGEKLVPVVNQLAATLAQYLPRAMEAATKAFATVARAVGDLAPHFTFIRGVVETVATFVADNLHPVLVGLGAAISAFVVPPFVAWAAAELAAIAPIVAVAAAIAGLVGGVIYAYQHFEAFRTVVDTVAKFLTDTVAPTVAKFAGYVAGQFEALVGWTREHWAAISEAVGHVLAVINDVIGVYAALFTAAWQAVGDDIGHIVKIAWGLVAGTIENALTVIRGVIDTALALINGDWGKAWDGLKEIFSGLWGQIVNVVGSGLDLVKSLLGGFGSIIAAIAGAMWDGFKDAFKAALNWCVDQYNAFTSHIPSIHLPGTSITIEAPTMAHLAAGGWAPDSFMAGERGPELVSLRPGGGAMVYPAHDPASQAAGGGMSFTFNIDVNASGLGGGDELRALISDVATHDIATAVMRVIDRSRAGSR